MKPVVVMPMQWVDRSIGWGNDLVEHYASGGSPRSLARSGPRGTESNRARQAQGKIGECALALYLGLDPEKEIKWAVQYADVGWDLRYGGLLIDAKTTLPKRKLIWSNTINDIYHDKAFDLMVALTTMADLSRVELDGYVTKDFFFENKIVSDGGDGLEAGTWCMSKDRLWPVEDLRNQKYAAVEAARRVGITWKYVQGIWPQGEILA